MEQIAATLVEIGKIPDAVIARAFEKSADSGIRKMSALGQEIKDPIGQRVMDQQILELEMINAVRELKSIWKKYQKLEQEINDETVA